MISPMVFSIRPKYVEAFRTGEKIFEFRTIEPSVKPRERVLIYETAPMSRIVCEAVVWCVLKDRPWQIWAQTYKRGVSHEEFERYFDEREIAVAVGMVPLRWFDPGIALPDGMAAPQSWARYNGEWAHVEPPWWPEPAGQLALC